MWATHAHLCHQRPQTLKREVRRQQEGMLVKSEKDFSFSLGEEETTKVPRGVPHSDTHMYTPAHAGRHSNLASVDVSYVRFLLVRAPFLSHPYMASWHIPVVAVFST